MKSLYEALDIGGIAIAGRSGSGKSSIFFGSQHIPWCIIADTGSMAHRRHAVEPDKVRFVNPLDTVRSPIQQVYDAVHEADKAGEAFVMDSFSTLQEAECSWMKRAEKKDKMSLPMHAIAVGQLRDLAMVLAQSRGFTIYNTSPGGVVRQPDGSYAEIPQGCITGYPALSGLAGGSETVLSRFTNVYVAFPGYAGKPNGDGGFTGGLPRGFIRPGGDIRPEHIKRYVPIKDHYGMLDGIGCDIADVTPHESICRFASYGTCTIDRLVMRMGVLPYDPEQCYDEKPAKKSAKK